MLLDLAMDLIVPPLSAIVTVACVGASVSTFLALRGVVSPLAAASWVVCPAMIMIYVARGVILSGAGARGFVDLAVAPLYVAWKLTLMLRRGNKQWVRTAREGERRP
jgi:hypothetical protein